MLITTREYTALSGWSEPLPRELDSEHTLVIAFAAPRYGEEPAPLRVLADAFPKACVIGCSTAGEIHHARVRDDSVVVAVVRFERTRARGAFSAIAPGEASFEAGKRLA